MKSIASIFTLLFTMALASLSPAPLRAADPAKGPEHAALGSLKLGQKSDAVIKVFGKPESKGKDVLWEATGDWVEEWRFPAQGLTINMASGKKGGAKTVLSITAESACKLATDRDIKIGSSLAEVRKAYGKTENKEESQPGKTFVAGSVYGGVIFNLKAGKVSGIFIGAAAE